MKTDSGNLLTGAYSLAKRSGILKARVGRQIFRSAYFLYKRYVEDELQGLLGSFPTLTRGGNVLDVGANIGYTAAILSGAVEPGGQVYAFEPEPFNFGLLQQTAHQSKFQHKIIPLQYAVGAENGAVELWINERHHGDHRIATTPFQSAHPEAKGISVPLVSIDSFLQGKQENFSFVKIDVQGYELAVCQGMRNTLKNNPRLTVFLEFAPSAMRDLGFEPSHLLDFFIDQGFKVYEVHSGGNLSLGMSAITKDSGYLNLLFSRRRLMGENHGTEHDN